MVVCQLLPNADIRPRSPLAAMCQKLTYAPQQKTSAVARLYFDHLVGAREQCRWHLEAKCPCGLQVDDELKLGRAQDRHVGRFLALENAAGIDAELAMLVSDVRSVAQHPATSASLLSRSDLMIYRQRGELHEDGSRTMGSGADH